MKKIRIVSLLSLLCAFFSCHAQDRAFESVSSDAFEKLIADTSVVRLDVRTAEEFEAGHIENAINIDVLKDDFEANALAILPVGKVLAVYCRSGRRSKKAAHILVKSGYRVIELDQGYNGWVESGKKVVR